MKVESRMVATRGWGQGEVGEMLVKGYKISIRSKKFKSYIAQHDVYINNNAFYS